MLVERTLEGTARREVPLLYGNVLFLLLGEGGAQVSTFGLTFILGTLSWWCHLWSFKSTWRLRFLNSRWTLLNWLIRLVDRWVQRLVLGALTSCCYSSLTAASTASRAVAPLTRATSPISDSFRHPVLTGVDTVSRSIQNITRLLMLAALENCRRGCCALRLRGDELAWAAGRSDDWLMQPSNLFLLICHQTLLNFHDLGGLLSTWHFSACCTSTSVSGARSLLQRSLLFKWVHHRLRFVRGRLH